MRDAARCPCRAGPDCGRPAERHAAGAVEAESDAAAGAQAPERRTPCAGASSQRKTAAGGSGRMARYMRRSRRQNRPPPPLRRRRPRPRPPRSSRQRPRPTTRVPPPIYRYRATPHCVRMKSIFAPVPARAIRSSGFTSVASCPWRSSGNSTSGGWCRIPTASRAGCTQATLSGRRSFMVTGADATLRRDAQDSAAPVAVLKAGVIGHLRGPARPNSDWCQVQVGDYRGYPEAQPVLGHAACRGLSSGTAFAPPAVDAVSSAAWTKDVPRAHHDLGGVVEIHVRAGGRGAARADRLRQGGRCAAGILGAEAGDDGGRIAPRHRGDPRGRVPPLELLPALDPLDHRQSAGARASSPRRNCAPRWSGSDGAIRPPAPPSG